jgi:hypothetical protein
MPFLLGHAPVSLGHVASEMILPFISPAAMLADMALPEHAMLARKIAM